jgi:hypothetical protein
MPWSSMPALIFLVRDNRPNRADAVEVTSRYYLMIACLINAQQAKL